MSSAAQRTSLKNSRIAARWVSRTKPIQYACSRQNTQTTTPPSTSTFRIDLASSTSPREENIRPNPLMGFMRAKFSVSAFEEKFQPLTRICPTTATTRQIVTKGATVSTASESALYRCIIINRIQWYDSLKFDYDNWPEITIYSDPDFKVPQTEPDTKYPMWFRE